jgi:hypothetical protein
MRMLPAVQQTLRTKSLAHIALASTTLAAQHQPPTSMAEDSQTAEFSNLAAPEEAKAKGGFYGLDVSRLLISPASSFLPRLSCVRSSMQACSSARRH